MIDFTKLAVLLDAVAGYVDNIEHQKTAEKREIHDNKIEQIVTHYANKTGESFSDTSKEKLSALDTDVLDEILKVANVTQENDSLDSLGGPANDVDTSLQPTTVKEAAIQAEEHFLNWIVSE